MESGNSSGEDGGIRRHKSHLRGFTGPASTPGELRDRIYQDLMDEARNQKRIVRNLTRFYDGIPCFSARDR